MMTDCRQPVTTRLFTFFSALLMLVTFAPAVQAKVTIAFYSHEFDGRFPHAFVKLEGTLEATGQRIDQNFGFTALSDGPSLYMGWARGGIDISKPDYIAVSHRRFAFQITDAQYRAVVAKMVEWRDRPGKNYHIDKHNCVHFVAEMATLLGVKINAKSRYWRRPEAFLSEVLSLNPGLKP